MHAKGGAQSARPPNKKRSRTTIDHPRSTTRRKILQDLNPPVEKPNHSSPLEKQPPITLKLMGRENHAPETSHMLPNITTSTSNPREENPMNPPPPTPTQATTTVTTAAAAAAAAAATETGTAPASVPAASANYMALLLSARGILVPTHFALRSQVIHLEPTLNYAIACAGYTETHKLAQQALEAAWQRLKVRTEDLKLYASVVLRDKSGVHLGLLNRGVRDLKKDVGKLEGLVLAAGRALVGDLSGRKEGLFEMDVHMKAVEMVGVRWEVEGVEF